MLSHPPLGRVPLCGSRFTGRPIEGSESLPAWCRPLGFPDGVTHHAPKFRASRPYAPIFTLASAKRKSLGVHC